jgi:hypothetical protein
MNKSLILNGTENLRAPFDSESPFYPGCAFKTADANQLDVSLAIGNARSADRSSLPSRIASLNRAASSFGYTQTELEHAVQMTGMPVRLMDDFLRQIPQILQDVGSIQGNRFLNTGGANPSNFEALGGGRFKVMEALDGFCYTAAPGNDPRVAALVAANLAYWGIPFILRASPRDVAAPLTIRALIRGGFDPKFCSLIYLDPTSPDSSQKHFKLVNAASIIWTFGPAQVIDPTLRFEMRGKRAVIDLEGLPDGIEPDLASLKKSLAEEGLEGTLARIRLEDDLYDHFETKTVLRHEAGNCAALAWGNLDVRAREILYQSLGYSIICTAVKTLLTIDSPGYIKQTAQFISELKAGDPLDPETQVGYIQPRHLDRLEALVQANQGRAAFYGGQRLSRIQAEPLLVDSKTDLPDFFGQEIPAYVLAAGECRDLEQAAGWLNRHQYPPRLAVTLLNSPERVRSKALQDLCCHAILVDKPTSTLAPALHEGNDYGLTFTQGRLLVT